LAGFGYKQSFGPRQPLIAILSLGHWNPFSGRLVVSSVGGIVVVSVGGLVVGSDGGLLGDSVEG
jgi:hypothetical protein